MQKTRKHWYVVAHGAGARIFEQQGINPTLQVVHRFDNPQGLLRTNELVSDRQGRSDRMGTFGHMPVGNDSGPKDSVLAAFIHELASFLKKEADQHAFDSLVLVAEPSVLGKLKAVIGQGLMDRMEEAVIHNLAHVADKNMVEALKTHLCRREEIHP